MEQVEEMCQYIALINKGKNVLYGEVQEIKNRFKQHLYKIESNDPFPEELGNTFKIHAQTEKSVTIQTENADQSNLPLKFLIDRNIHIRSFQELLPSFDEIFIRTVGEQP
jgi:ABC-2 type transport system ATP-binding protein